MGEQGPFRSAGGPRGVDDVGGVGAVHPGARGCLGLAVTGVRERHRPRRHRRPPDSLRAGEQHCRAGVLEQEVQPFRRVARIQGHGDAAGLEHGEQGRHPLERALGADRDRDLWAHAQPAQAVGHAVGAAVELRAGPAPRAVGDGLVAGRPLGPSLPEPVQQIRRGEADRGVVEAYEHLAAVGVGQQLELGERGLRTVDGAGEQGEPVPAQPFDVAGCKARRVVGQRGRERLRRDQQGEGDLEPFAAGGALSQADGEPAPAPLPRHMEVESKRQGGRGAPAGRCRVLPGEVLLQPGSLLAQPHDPLHGADEGEVARQLDTDREVAGERPLSAGQLLVGTAVEGHGHGEVRLPGQAP